MISRPFHLVFDIGLEVPVRFRIRVLEEEQLLEVESGEGNLEVDDD
jgi:hypothetical protein